MSSHDEVNARFNNFVEEIGLDYQAYFFLGSFWAFILLSVICAIPFCSWQLYAHRRKLTPNERSKGCTLTLVALNFAAISFWLLAWTMLVAFSYIPWWAGAIILTASAIVAWFFGFVFKQNFLRQSTLSNILRVIVLVLAIAFCWVLPALTRDLCVTFQPVTFSFRISRVDPCSLVSPFPCHNYILFGTNASTTTVFHFHADVEYAAPQVRFDVVPRSQVGDYASVVTAEFYKLPLDEIDRYVYYGYVDTLQPDTTYYYVLGDAATGWTTERKFKTAPGKSSNFTFISGGDMGLSKETYMLTAIGASKNPLFGSIGGDIAYCNGVAACYQRWDDWIKMWEDTMITPSGHYVPIIAAIGNHEAGGFYKTLRQTMFYSSYFVHERLDGRDPHNIPQSHYHFIGDSMLISLDSDVNYSPASQAPWLQEVFQNFSSSYTFRFAIYHAPLYPAVRSEMVATSKARSLHGFPREAWGPIFDNYLTVGLENHDHSYKRSKHIRNNAPVEDTTAPVYIGDGCWGVPPEQPDLTRWYIEHAAQSRYVLQLDVSSSAKTVQLNMWNENNVAFDQYLVQK